MSEKEEMTQEVSSNKGGNKKMVIRAVIVLVIAIAIGSFVIMRGDIDKSPTIATVNGEKVKQSELDSRMKQVTESLKAQGNNTEDPTLMDSIKKQIIDELISNKLVLQKAKESNVNIDKKEAVAQLEDIKKRIGDENTFKQQLEAIGRTEDQLINDIHEQMIINKYVSDNIDPNALTVSDEEIQSFYDQVKSTQTDIPEIEVVKEQIRAQIASSKQQELSKAFIDKLKSEAEIKIM